MSNSVNEYHHNTIKREIAKASLDLDHRILLWQLVLIVLRLSVDIILSKTGFIYCSLGKEVAGLVVHT